MHKALGLLVRSNAAVLEWLASPITDRRDERTVAGLVGVARLAAHRPALECHHDRLARGAWPPADGESAGFKALFYALRPALALVWSRRVGAPLPMDLPSLMGASRRGRSWCKRSRHCERAKRPQVKPTRPRFVRRWKPSYPRCSQFVRGVQCLGTKRPPSPRPTPCSYTWWREGRRAAVLRRIAVRRVPQPARSHPRATTPTPCAPRLRSRRVWLLDKTERRARTGCGLRV